MKPKNFFKDVYDDFFGYAVEKPEDINAEILLK